MSAGQSTALGDPFVFDYEINCHSLTRPLATEESLIIFFGLGAVVAVLATLMIICFHHRSAARAAATTKEVPAAQM
jgi:hypothetical protein